MCKLCETKPVYEFTNKRKVCKNCFVRYFQKKFLTTIRKFGMVNKGDAIGYEGKKGFRDVVLADLLFMFSEKGFVEVVRVEKGDKGYGMGDEGCGKLRKKVDKVAISSTIDSESDKIVHILVKGNVKDLKEIKPVDKKVIKPLYLFLDKEVMLYAKIKGLRFSEKKEKKDRLSRFVDDLEKKHPEIKRAILNSYLELE